MKGHDRQQGSDIPETPGNPRRPAPGTQGEPQPPLSACYCYCVAPGELAKPHLLKVWQALQYKGGKVRSNPSTTSGLPCTACMSYAPCRIPCTPQGSEDSSRTHTGCAAAHSLPPNPSLTAVQRVVEKVLNACDSWGHQVVVRAARVTPCGGLLRRGWGR